MADIVSNQIIFDVAHKDHVFSFFSDEYFNFNLLIPAPLHMYQGDTSLEDEKDFKCNWYDWCYENWGTKWNACGSKFEVEDGKAIISFDTAWGPPYPIIVAFANKFRIPFEHRYVEEDGDEGIEVWQVGGKNFKDDTRMTRISKTQIIEGQKFTSS